LLGGSRARGEADEFSDDESTRDALRAWKAQQATERLAFGPVWHADGGLRIEAPWVVTEPDGMVIHPDTLHDRFVRLAKRAGLRHIVLHGTRHSFATIASRRVYAPMW
jgi:integrase